MKRIGLRARFILLILGLFVFLFAIAAVVLVRQNTHTLKTGLNEQSKSFASLATKPIGDTFVLYKDSGRVRIQQQVNKFTDLNPDISNVTIADVGGHVMFSKNNASPPQLTPDIASTFTTKTFTNTNGAVSEVVAPFIEDFGVHRYTIIYTVSDERINRNIEQVVAAILTFSVITLLAMVVITYQLINRFFLSPVRQISEEALEISKGDFNRQIANRRNDEIGDVARAVNTMADSLKGDIVKLQEVDKLKSEFLMITSHNLRTPLTIMSGYLDLLKSHKMDDELRAAFEAISANTTRLGTFTEDILTISTIETGDNIMHMKPDKLKPIIDQIASEFQVIAKQKKLTFSFVNSLAEEQVNISKQHFRSAIWNLLDNAYKFTPEAGNVMLEAKHDGDKLSIKVTDSGIGISQEELPKLFTKFHRGTSTMTYDYEGTGIGLYISKLIIERQGGTIEVNSTIDKGSSFTILIPIAEPKHLS